MNNVSLSPEFQNLMTRLDHLDAIDPFQESYYAEMQSIAFELECLKARTKSSASLQSTCDSTLKLYTHTSNKYMALILESLSHRYVANAKQADDLETLIYSNINSYDFKAMGIKIKAQVDFLDLYFEIDKDSTRHDIKKFLTEKTGITHYISEFKNGFIIRLHDMNSIDQLRRRIQHLNHFKCKGDSFRIMEIELAIDFYRFKHKALVTALLKSIRLPSTATNFRVFKSQLGVFNPLPKMPLTLIKKIENGYNIGINHRDADEYWHLYVKTTDHNKQPLHESEWRVRAEKNIKHNILSSMDNRLMNLKSILLKGFKELKFTQLEATAPQPLKDLYRDSVQPFGLEQEVHYGRHRHKRTLPDFIKSNADLNQIVSSAVYNLLRSFSINI
ncbi:hypothetical protein ACT4YA_10270 [Acinetobacter baumannii]|uniref:hypothetical protein n=1 Tax=Acinetobacter sp. 1179249 TaxID=1310790 RepID=UPI00044FD585|nr:hypothetical protein [Acinetobacter sp. 1179249]EXR29867.1 hypothetical protein J689_2928 [Acinetobacter sp. 1179249]